MVRVEEVAVLVEDLDAVVPPVGHEEAPGRIELQRVRGAELARAESDFAPLLDEFAVLVELQDPAGAPLGGIRALPAVAVGDEDVPVRRGDDIAGAR